MSTATTTSPLTQDALPHSHPIPHSAFTIPHSPKSFHTFTDTLIHASTQLDDLLKDLDLSKEETEALLASQKYASHRQLRTRLLSEQLQLTAQTHAQSAITRLVELSHSHHPATARLATTQLLAYANLTPPPPQSPPATAGAVPPPRPSRPP